MFEDYTSLFDEAFKKLKNQEGELRFNRSIVIASDLAQQYFCEKKVERGYVLGEIETERKSLGTEAHQKLLEGSEKVKREELWQKIFSEKPVLALETLLLARYKNVILAGRPDCILFHKGLPIMIFEYKFSERLKPFRDHHVQARTYGVLLNRMGFETERLSYTIATINPRTGNKETLRRKIVNTVVRNGPKEAILRLEEARIYVNRFDLVEAEKDLDWALDFWTGRREAIPKGNPNKCKSCEYSSKCKDAIK